MNTHHANRLQLLLIGLLALTLAVGGWAAAPTVTQAQSDEQLDTLSQLTGVIIPERDRNDLALRLLGVEEIPDPPESAPAYEVGDVVTFWADNLDEDYQFQVDARLVYATDHIYMFVEEGVDLPLDRLQRSADHFEEVIRPHVHEVFGQEWLPGIDGDPHLFILHARNLGSWVAAYYDSSSEYATQAVPSSNQREMFFVNLDAMGNVIGTDYYESVLAHEFQHMVHWNVDRNEDTWLNEGLSELASMITGYGPSGFLYDFLQNPNIQLNAWPEDNNRGVHYGAAFAFVAYFYDRYGEAATTALVSDAQNGLTSIDEALQRIDARDPSSGEPVDLVDLFGDWLVTNRVQNATLGDGRYAYHFGDLGLVDVPPARITAEIAPDGVSYERAAPQWGPEYLYVSGGAEAQTLQFSFEGSPMVPVVPANAHSGQYMWWGNRADDSDTRLTQRFDLSGVEQATLKYWTWYFIEEGWDYGYVMVSTDDGRTWTPLETSRTITDDPHGNAYGPGYSGRSGDWVEETVDLTPYVGGEVLVRFEYITDDAVTQPGFLIDDVSIPEIGYASDFESGDGGWRSEGWLRMDNALAQTFLVQLVQPGADDAPVTRWLSPDEGTSGTWTFEVGGAAGDAVIIVSGLAPVTTEPAAYRYSLSPASE